MEGKKLKKMLPNQGEYPARVAWNVRSRPSIVEASSRPTCRDARTNLPQKRLEQNRGGVCFRSR